MENPSRPDSTWRQFDGSNKCPPEYIIAASEENGAAQVANPEYTLCSRVDQTLMAGLIGTLSIEVLAKVTLLDRFIVRGVDVFVFNSSKVMQIHVQLAHLQKAKGLTDAMAAIDKPLSDEKIIAYILAGLDEHYVWWSCRRAGSPQSCSQSRRGVLAFTGHNVRVWDAFQFQSAQPGASATYSNRGGRGGGGPGLLEDNLKAAAAVAAVGNFNRGGGKQGQGGVRGGGDRSNGHSGGYSGNHNNGNGNGGGRPHSAVPHLWPYWPHRFDHSIQPDDPRVANYSNGNSSYQVYKNTKNRDWFVPWPLGPALLSLYNTSCTIYRLLRLRRSNYLESYSVV